MLNTEKRHYHLEGMTKILGAQSADPKVRSAYIGKKAATLEKCQEEEAMLPEDVEKMNLSVFLRCDGALCLQDYVIKGFLKEALTTIKADIGVLNAASKVDNYVSISPAYLVFSRNGSTISAPDEIYERPLRAMTMQGPRVSVTASETIHPAWALDFDIELLHNTGTPKSRALTFEAIDAAMEYGQFKGLGQWRNAQNGRFTFTVSEAKEEKNDEDA